MNIKQWKDIYVELVNIAKLLDSTCPFISDDNIHCDECCIRFACQRVHETRTVLNPY